MSTLFGLRRGYRGNSYGCRQRQELLPGMTSEPLPPPPPPPIININGYTAITEYLHYKTPTTVSSNIAKLGLRTRTVSF